MIVVIGYIRGGCLYTVLGENIICGTSGEKMGNLSCSLYSGFQLLERLFLFLMVVSVYHLGRRIDYKDETTPTLCILFGTVCAGMKTSGSSLLRPENYQQLW